ncbi:excinuclease ABC subunit UvrC [Methanospirillum stamsii]|uniref:UvrABC system protein C n=1 Tax=Methanospirillum stamsii TaxID=1277351 RepID=A0A2V2NCI6_9EURY|nr:excinuclease ABC subunit UvrC [Methanospirillum stamsii]PWR73301.1 excinuclease ABC subunit C [Methanospirillum stamsii]
MTIDLSTIPEEPGCYQFKDESGNILYVGKAKNLKKRVSSYFQKKSIAPRTDILVSLIRDIDTIVTSSEVEALILENNLIKKYQPKYNIDLKDAKSYAFIQLTDEPFPRIGIARERNGKIKGTLYGPFVSAAERDQILKFIKQTFHLRTCKKITKRACLRSHLGTCAAPCIGKISEPEYQYLVKSADLLLRGKNQDLISSLKEEMQNFSDSEEFEKALVLRNRIQAIENLSERQYVQRQKKADEHIINYIISGDMVYLILFHVERGSLTSKEEFVFQETEDFLDEFILQYYATNKPPNELILPIQPEQGIQEYLMHIRGTNVTITVPKQGEKKHLIDLAYKNLEVSFFTGKMRLSELGEALHMDNPPEVIECFDISHLRGTGTVGSMVSFRDGKPDKRNYRRYKIKTAGPSDDYAAISEVVKRRYSRLLSENHPMPDLILIDGGPGQLKSAKTVLDELNLSIPVISLAKREEEIYVPGRHLPLSVQKKSPASLLVQEIRDEAHRFAITYQRKLRQKQMKE